MEAPNEQEIVGARIREEREARDLTLQQLADQAGLDYTALSRVERNERGISSAQLRRVARVLEVDMDSFFERPSEAVALLRADGDFSAMLAFGEALIRDIEFVQSLDA